jgi:hypothetical protein
LKNSEAILAWDPETRARLVRRLLARLCYAKAICQPLIRIGCNLPRFFRISRLFGEANAPHEIVKALIGTQWVKTRIYLQI